MCLGCSGERVAAVQRQLGRLGLYDGEISGLYDLGTGAELKIFRGNTALTRAERQTAGPQPFSG